MNYNLKLNKTILNYVFEFLTLIDYAKCEQVCKSWKNFLQNNKFWQNIDTYGINLQQNDNQQLFETWIINKVRLYQPIKLQLLDYKQQWDLKSIIAILSLQHSNLIKLNLFYKIEDMDQQKQIENLIAYIIKTMPNLKCLKTHGNYLNDTNTQLLKNLNKLETFCILNDDIEYFGSNLYQLKSLSKIVLRSHCIEFSNLLALIKNSQGTLKKLVFDCENFSDNEVRIILDMLQANMIQKLKLYYCETVTDAFKSVQKFSKLKQLAFKKAQYCISFKECFNNIQTTTLLKLDLSECQELNDDELIILIKKNTQLEKVKLSWCGCLSSASIAFLFNACPQLKSLVLRGQKKLTEAGFPQLQNIYKGLIKTQIQTCKTSPKPIIYPIEQFFLCPVTWKNISLYQNLKKLDVQKCNDVPDDILYTLKIFRPYVQILDYYGNNITLQADKEEEDL